MPQPFNPAAQPRDPEATRKLLAALWERSLPMMQERLAQLERAVASVRAGTLTPEQRREAIETAHKLAGSLGMFGYPDGTEFARHIEQHLEEAGPVDALRLADDVAAMRSTLSL